MVDRVYESNAAAGPPSAPSTPSAGYPTAGDPVNGVPATKPGAYWYHMITESLVKVIEAAGLTPDHANLAQLLNAMNALFLRSDTTSVFTGSRLSLTAGGIQVHFDEETAADGFSIKRITCNDGFGNWNFRSGCYSSGGVNPELRYTTAGFGAANISLNHENTTKGEIKLEVFPPGANAGDPVSGGKALIVDSLGTFKWAGNDVWTAGNVATQAEAEAGTNNAKAMTPLRVAQAISARSQSHVVLTNATTQSPSAINVWQRRTNWAIGEDNGSSSFLTRNDATGQFTVTKSGVYEIRYSDYIGRNGLSTTTALCFIGLQIVSGAAVSLRAGSRLNVGIYESSATLTTSRRVLLNAGDVIEPVFNFSHLTPVVSGNSAYSQISIAKVG